MKVTGSYKASHREEGQLAKQAHAVCLACVVYQRARDVSCACLKVPHVRGSARTSNLAVSSRPLDVGKQVKEYLLL